MDQNHLCAEETDRHIDHATCDICNNRPYMQALWPKNTISAGQTLYNKQLTGIST